MKSSFLSPKIFRTYDIITLPPKVGVDYYNCHEYAINVI
jgi:hypothetical protein